MKIKILLPIFLFSFFNGFTQIQTYHVFSYTQKIVNAGCNTAELINDSDVNLTPQEAATYEVDERKKLRATYTSKNRYGLVSVKLVEPHQVAIFYESVTTVNAWKCTNSAYDVIIANNISAAEKQFEDRKKQHKGYEFKEIKRWGKGIVATKKATVKAEDVSINWKKTNSGIVAGFTNTRSDIPLTVEIVSLKKDTIPSVGNAMQMVATEKKTITLKPGEKLNLNLKAADGFNVETIPAPSTTEQKGAVEKGKILLRQFIKDSGTEPYKSNNVGIGVRG